MIEVLVALAVLAVGLLGIAALYLDSLRAGRTAIYRTQAINVAADLADRVRANREAAASYNADFADAVAAVDCNDPASPCTAGQMAQHDLSEWKALLATLVPNGQGRVVFAAGNPNSYVITVQWTEPGSDGALSYTLTVES
jgi:type IV pilus assembly protein PilV